MKMRDAAVSRLVHGIESTCHPLFMWGDDAEFNESHEKLIVCVLGHALSEETFSVRCVFPLWTIRNVSWLSVKTCPIYRL